jgi:hypothetical protein
MNGVQCALGIMADGMNVKQESVMAKQKIFHTIRFVSAISIVVVASSLTGCAVVAVADAAVTVASTAVKVTAKTVGVAADIVLPSSDKKVDKEKSSAKKNN